MFIDIGTNGELVAGNAEFLLAGAGAAGPALEGGISLYGMRADTGAVDRVRIEEGRLKIHTIGEGRPRGICGSGIVVSACGAVFKRLGGFAGTSE